MDSGSYTITGYKPVKPGGTRKTYEKSQTGGVFFFFFNPNPDDIQFFSCNGKGVSSHRF
jgi:hypothetical protein